MARSMCCTTRPARRHTTSCGRALEIDVGDIRVAVAGRDDLINMKRASARPVDLADLAALTAFGNGD